MSQLAHIGVRVLAIVLFVGALAVLYSQIHAQPEIVGTGIRIQQLRQEISAAEREIRTLEEELAYRRSDSYVIEVAKAELDLVEPGEQQLLLSGLPIPAVAPAPVPASGTTPLPAPAAHPSPLENLAAWWDVLNGR
jgi:cell division protein FtsB